MCSNLLIFKNNTLKAANYLLHRDHKKLRDLLDEYYHGKLGVYMVPPMFFGQVPEAIQLSQYKVGKHFDNVKGDIAERNVFYELEKYYSNEGDDVLIIHSHKFLNNESNNEKDFLVFNLTKGNLYYHIIFGPQNYLKSLLLDIFSNLLI